MIDMMSQKELEKKLFKYKMLEETTKVLTQRKELLLTKMLEIENTLDCINEIQKSKGEIFLPLGSSVYVPGTIKKLERMIVGLGAGVSVEKDVNDTKKILNQRRKVLEENLKSVEAQILKVDDEMSKLEPEIRKLIKSTSTKQL